MVSGRDADEVPPLTVEEYLKIHGPDFFFAMLGPAGIARYRREKLLRLYDDFKDGSDCASLEDIREETGLSEEAFYWGFTPLIEKEYELIPGGEEGIRKGGAVYGIIRKKSSGDIGA